MEPHPLAAHIKPAFPTKDIRRYILRAAGHRAKRQIYQGTAHYKEQTYHRTPRLLIVFPL